MDTKAGVAAVGEVAAVAVAHTGVEDKATRTRVATAVAALEAAVVDLEAAGLVVAGEDLVVVVEVCFCELSSISPDCLRFSLFAL